MESKPVVGHLAHTYLILTGSWIYHQLTGLRRYHPVVMTRLIQNFEQFPLNDVFSFPWPLQHYRYLGKLVREFDELIVGHRLREYTEKLFEEKAVLLHAHFGFEGYQNLKVARVLQLPMITTFYGLDVSMLPKSKPIWQKRYQKLFADGDYFLAEGPFMAQSLVDLGCPPSKVCVQHLGVNLQRILFRERVRLPDEPVRFLMAASFREKKGIPLAIEAFSNAFRKFKQMELHIIGGANSEDEIQLFNHCKTLVRQNDMTEHVHFLGYLTYEQYLHEIEQAHIFLAPSITAQNGDTEGGAPVSVIEASASGLPVIASRHCDIPDVIEDGQGGVLVNERDIAGLSRSMLELATSQEQWPEMGRVGRRHIETEYDGCTQVSRLEDIYDAVSGCQRPFVQENIND